MAVGTASFDNSGPSVVLAGQRSRDSIAIYGSVDHEYQFDDISQSIGGEIGLRVRW